MKFYGTGVGNVHWVVITGRKAATVYIERLSPSVCCSYSGQTIAKKREQGKNGCATRCEDKRMEEEQGVQYSSLCRGRCADTMPAAWLMFISISVCRPVSIVAMLSKVRRQSEEYACGTLEKSPMSLCSLCFDIDTGKEEGLCTTALTLLYIMTIRFIGV